LSDLCPFDNPEYSLMKRIQIDSKDQLGKVVQMILETYQNYRIFAFYGELGSGKTTTIQEICRKLKMNDVVHSPSFSIVNEYRSGEGLVVYHFDLYRIEKIEEVYDLGYEDYFYSGNYCFIEWPELIEEILPAGTVPVSIEADVDGKRFFRFGQPR
jgi:tRNA threonylcarbamoyladenosine biosynthesis protein TsaE